MNIPELTIIPAGAGSGKTYTIQQTLAKWVKNKLVAPEKIVAVTFTNAAAGELRERIRQQLVTDNRLEDALKLDQAYISTIHSFGLRLLTEFAFDAGLSPEPRLLNDDEEAILIRHALAKTGKADIVMMNLESFGYHYNFLSGKGGEALFRDRILDLIGKLRTIGRLKHDDVLIPHALAAVEKLYGRTQLAGFLNDALHAAVLALLRQFPEPLADRHPDNKVFVTALEDNFQALKKAEDISAIEADWKLWQKLRSLRLSNSRAPLPSDYEALAENVISEANNLPMHPGPLAQALTHVEALLGVGQECLSRYAENKREKGLVDYTDMLAVGHQIVCQPEILSEIRKRIDCLVIDEFQDTNPLQFSLLWALHDSGIPTLIVGDLKQAIMGFQNADSRLLEQLQKQNSQYSQPLTGNWRSTPSLMSFVNAVGEGLFRDDYTHLTPRAEYPSTLSPLEVIEFPENWRGSKERQIESPGVVRPRHTAARIMALLNEPNQMVYDRHSRSSRKMRPGDIAVLCPTNSKCDDYANALRELGIRSRLEQEGWSESPVVQIVLHALSYVADPNDVHAGLFLSVTELGKTDLQSALALIIDGKGLSDPILRILQPIRAFAPDLTIKSIVSKIIENLDLYQIVSSWPDSEQARANLLRLQGETERFMTSNREALASGGFYGTGIKSFLSWLTAKIEIDNSQPDPRVVDEDAVALMTWHKSKGKEWPVVVIAASDAEVKNPLPSLDVVYKDFSDLNKLLEEARIEMSPDFVAPETCEIFKGPLWRIAKDSALRLLYVALSRGREKVILEWPSYLDNPKNRTKIKYWEVLREVTGITYSGNQLALGEKTFDCRSIKTNRASPIEYDDREEVVEKLPVIGLRALKAGSLPTDLTPDSVTPSTLRCDEDMTDDSLKQLKYGSSLKIDLPLPGIERGNLLHRCFEILSTNQDADLICRATGTDLTVEQFNTILNAVQLFESFLEQEFNPLSLEREAPVLFIDKNSSVVSGFVDLLVETAEGYWIIDHKSDQANDLQEKFGKYLSQLQSYAEGVGKAHPDKKVIGVAINWISAGTLTFKNLAI